MTSWVSHWPYVIKVSTDEGRSLERGHDVIQWLLTNYPHLKHSTANNTGDWDIVYSDHVYEVAFKDPDMATIFKLAWGGK